MELTEREALLILGWWWIVVSSNPQYKTSDEENDLIDRLQIVSGEVRE